MELRTSPLGDRLGTSRARQCVNPCVNVGGTSPQRHTTLTALGAHCNLNGRRGPASDDCLRGRDCKVLDVGLRRLAGGWRSRGAEGEALGIAKRPSLALCCLPRQFFALEGTLPWLPTSLRLAGTCRERGLCAPASPVALSQRHGGACPDPATRGCPEGPLLWTILNAGLAWMLQARAYGSQANRKTTEGRQPRHRARKQR